MKPFGETLHKAYTRSNLRTDLAALEDQLDHPPFKCFGGSSPRGEGGGVLPGILGGGVPPGASNPDPISDLNMPFSTPVFRPDL